MKNGPKFGKDYYEELLQTIKEIRLSERRLYQKLQMYLKRQVLIITKIPKKHIHF